MCGISGIIDKNHFSISPNLMENINNIAKHRGPDGEGYFFDKNLAFGHRRLSIIDLSEHGKQPMSYLDRYVLTFNGEIYNYIELKDELIKQGYSFNSKTDTEVILAAYDFWGPNCVQKFNGMWAFAIYDKKSEIVFCSRDRFGVKPFYYFSNDKKFGFASEIKQLLPLQQKKELNEEIFLTFLLFNIVDFSKETFFKNIYKLPPSHNLIYSLKDNNFKIEQYYNLPKSPEKAFKSAFEESIKLRLRSDVKVGTSLSGGLDSSLVASLASKIHYQSSSQKFNAIHGKSVEKETDESYFANLLADYSNLEIHVIEPTSNTFLENIDEVILAQEEPFLGPSIFMQYFVFKKAKELGIKVMLDGQGSDEILFGYKGYIPQLLNFYKKEYGSISFLKELSWAYKNNDIRGVSLTGRRILNKIKTKFLKSKVANTQLNYPYQFTKYLSYRENIKSSKENPYQMHFNEIFFTTLPALLRYSDKNSMRNSVEARLPFMDYNVVEASVSLDLSNKFKGGWTKLPIRRDFKEILPEEIAWRKCKLGFNAPDRTWLSSIEREMENDVLNNSLMLHFFKKGDLKKVFQNRDLNAKWRFFNASRWSSLMNVSL